MPKWKMLICLGFLELPYVMAPVKGKYFLPFGQFEASEDRTPANG
jgi:hypothetical protein